MQFLSTKDGLDSCCAIVASVEKDMDEFKTHFNIYSWIILPWLSMQWGTISIGKMHSNPLACTVKFNLSPAINARSCSNLLFFTLRSTWRRPKPQCCRTQRPVPCNLQMK